MFGTNKSITLILALAMVILGAGSVLAQFNITGTVVDPASAPVDSVEIRLFTDGGFPIGIPLTLTDTAGNYTIAGLPAGGYILQFRPLTSDKLLAVELPATIAGGNTVRNANLQAGFLFFGYVRDINGVGIPSIDLQVWDRDTGDQMLTPGDDTNALGFYDVVLPLGEYDVEWRAVAAGSLPYITVADRILVEADTQWDVVMQIGWPVSGTVRDNVGLPLFNINMDFIDVATGIKLDTPGDNTALDGTYTVSLPVGTYEVVAKPTADTRLLTGFLPSVVVTGPTPGVDFDLQLGNLMTGTVTGPAGPVTSVNIDVIDAITGQDVALAFDTTNGSGQYQVVVPTGQIHVLFLPPGGSPLAPQLMTSLAVAGDLIQNATLVTGLILSGTVSGPAGPVPGTDLDMKDPVSGVSIPLRGDNTDANGVFQTMAGPGTYILEIEPPLAAGLVAQLDPAFTLAANTNLNVVLEAGARVTGTVTGSTGGVLPDVGLDVLRTSDSVEIFTPGSRTDLLGQYEIIVPLDSYTFFFKLGASHAVPDSLTLPNIVVTGDMIVDAVFNAGISGVDEDLPPVSDLGLTAYPNPFNPRTTISFEQKADGRARVTIHQLDGSLVAILADEFFSRGPQNLVWQGLDQQGRRAASGVYLVAVSTERGWQAAKVALVK